MLGNPNMKAFLTKYKWKKDLIIRVVILSNSLMLLRNTVFLCRVLLKCFNSGRWKYLFFRGSLLDPYHLKLVMCLKLLGKEWHLRFVYPYFWIWWSHQDNNSLWQMVNDSYSVGVTGWVCNASSYIMSMQGVTLTRWSMYSKQTTILAATTLLGFDN